MASQEIFEAKISSKSFPPRLPGNKLAVRYRVKSSDLNQATTWSPVYYIDGPITNATSNSLGGITTTKFELEWVDTNVSNYDIFASYYIELADYNARVNSVGTTKTIYFLSSETSSDYIPQELANFQAGDLINVTNVNLALNGTDMTVTEVQLSTLPYYIRYTGDSSNSLANTTEITGYFGIGSNATAAQESRQYQYFGTYSWIEESKKSYIFKKAAFKPSTFYTTAKVIVQLEGIKKTLDPTLQIVRTDIAAI